MLLLRPKALKSGSENPLQEIFLLLILVLLIDFD